MGWTKEWENKNRKRNNARRQELRKVKRRWLVEQKKGPCVDCGKRFPFMAMDFDHVKGRKRFNVGDNMARSIEQMTREIAKCDLVCSNCHRIRTWRRNHP